MVTRVPVMTAESGMVGLLGIVGDWLKMEDEMGFGDFGLWGRGDLQ